MALAMELELKLGLTHPGQLPTLLAALPEPLRVISQSNHYFVDALGELKARRTMVRVRVSRTLGDARPLEVTLTTKRRLEAKAGYFIAEEEEEAISPEAWEAVQGGACDLVDLDTAPLKSLALTPPLICHGVMHNLRHVIALKGFTLEVDRTEFPKGVIGAEVEVETTDPTGARRVVEEVAERAGVALFDQERGKYARFLAALKLEAL